MDFTTQSRSDEPISFASGYAVKTLFRVSEINIKFNGATTSLADINGDGFADIIIGKVSSYQDLYLWSDGGVYTSASTSWSNIPYIIDATGNDRGIRFGEFNGDGFADYLENRSGASSTMYINKADGTGWATGVSSGNTEDFVDASGNDTGLRVMDINGEGFDDTIRGQKDVSPRILLNEGGGTSWRSNSAIMSAIPDIVGTDGAPRGTKITDINGDGLLDLVVSDHVRGQKFYLNRGNGANFVHFDMGAIPYFMNTPDTLDIGTRIIEGNEDGIPDFVISSDWGKLNYLSSGNPVDVLTTVTLPTGGSIAVTYSGYRAHTSLFKVVETVTSTPQNGGDPIVYDYDYGTGAYCIAYQNRKFAGFSEIARHDSQGNRVRTFFHQGNGEDTSEYDDDEAKIGHPYRVDRDIVGSADPYERTLNRWEKIDLGSGRTFVYLRSALNRSFDGTSTSTDSGVTSEYATSTGNLIQKIEWGQVFGNTNGTFTDTGTDKRTTTYNYATGSSFGVTGLLSGATTTDHVGGKAQEPRYYYDSLSLGSVNKGNLTNQEFWKATSSYANIQKPYNSYGLVTQDTDPRGKNTTHVYDSFNLYVATSTNPVGHEMGYLYDYSSGKVKQTTDANNLVFQMTYDGLDRPLLEKQPDLTTPSALVTKTAYAYADNTVPSYAKRTSYLNSATTTDHYSYFDGLGRLIQERIQAEDSNTFAIKDKIYNAQGLLHKESLPCFGTGASSSATTTTAALYASYAYDPLGRPTTTTNAVGTLTTSYQRWKTTVTDMNRHYRE